MRSAFSSVGSCSPTQTRRRFAHADARILGLQNLEETRIDVRDSSIDLAAQLTDVWFGKQPLDITLVVNFQ
jgi:hypothetical protein